MASSAFKTPAHHTRFSRKPYVKKSYRLTRKTKTAVKVYDCFSDDDDNDSTDEEEQKNTLKPHSLHTERLIKTCVKQSSHKMRPQNLTSTCPKKKDIDVDDVGDHLSHLTLDTSPSRCFLKVPNPCSEESDVGILDAKSCVTQPNTERKRRVTRKVKDDSIPSVLVFSPDEHEACPSDVDIFEKEVVKQVRGRPRKTNATKCMKSESNKGSSSSASTRPKTRSSRTLR